jgi:hypothetical protein
MSILDRIGGTPLVPLSRIAAGVAVPVLANCEHRNAGGSVKDRIAEAIVDDAEARGMLRRSLHDLEVPHHARRVVLENVAVVHPLARTVVGAKRDRDRLLRGNIDRVLPRRASRFYACELAVPSCGAELEHRLSRRLGQDDRSRAYIDMMATARAHRLRRSGGHLMFILMALACGCSKAAPPEPRGARAGSESGGQPAADSWLPPGGSPPPAGVVVPAVGRAVEARSEPPHAANVWYGKFEVDPKDPAVVKYVGELVAQGITATAAYGEIGKELYLRQVTGKALGTDSYPTPDGKLSVYVKGSLDSDKDNFFELFVGVPGG